MIDEINMVIYKYYTFFKKKTDLPESVAMKHIDWSSFRICIYMALQEVLTEEDRSMKAGVFLEKFQSILQFNHLAWEDEQKEHVSVTGYSATDIDSRISSIYMYHTFVCSNLLPIKEEEEQNTFRQLMLFYPCYYFLTQQFPKAEERNNVIKEFEIDILPENATDIEIEKIAEYRNEYYYLDYVGIMEVEKYTRYIKQGRAAYISFQKGDAACIK